MNVNIYRVDPQEDDEEIFFMFVTDRTQSNEYKPEPRRFLLN